MEKLEKKQRTTTVREDIISYLKVNSNVTNPFYIAKNKHRHVGSIRRELREMSRSGLINLEINPITKHYTLIELKSLNTNLSDTKTSLPYSGKIIKKENIFVKIFRKIF